MNDDAELYQKNNNMQKRDALQCLEKYGNRIKWKNFGDRIIDVGCGDGSVTCLLKKYLPCNFKKLVGCDISENMVNFANEHHMDEQTTFTVLDIAARLPDNLREDFDHVFSFYALHWIKYQEDAFRNIYDLLKEGGDCLMIILGHVPIFDVYRILSQTEKWKFWLKDVDRFISPYHDSQDPALEVRKMMQEIGFTDIDVKCEDMVFVFDDINVLKKTVTAINPFKIPKDMIDEFIDDYLKVVQDMRLIDRVNNNLKETVIVRFNYTLLVVYGCKGA